MREWHKSQSFLEALQFAWAGILDAYHREDNLRRQTAIFAAAIALGIVLRLPLVQLSIIVLCGGLVLGLEFINSALERMQDLLWPEYHDAIKLSKDIAAGAVLMASITASIVGLLIFIPPLANLFGLLY